MDLKFTSFLFRYQPFLYYRKHNGRLMNEMKKIKRWGQETFQNSAHIDKTRAKRTLPHFVPAYRSYSVTSTLPFLLTAPELLVIKLVCL